MVYRSAWGVRILLSNRPWDAERIAALRKFCDERSFDVSWYPGMDPAAARASIYNDLPAVSFASGEVTSDGPDDAIADEAGAVLAGAPTPSRTAFNLAPITLDRPFFYAVLRLDQLGTILKRLEILPQAEVGALVNLAVLAQAVVIALLVLLVPLAAPRRLRLPEIGLLRADRVFPGAGPRLPVHRDLPDREGEPVAERPHLRLRPGADRDAGVLRARQHGGGPTGRGAAPWHRAGVPGRHRLVRRGAGRAAAGRSWRRSDLPWLARAALVLAVLAPVSLALGLPFPLGLARTGSGGFLPWAWGLNGAFSVVATPLANLIAREAGFSRVLLCAAVLYVVALVMFPAARKSRAWQLLSARSRAAE